MKSRKRLQPYKHDCDQCIWVGWVPWREAQDGYGNMYYCPRCDGGTIVIRYGDEPSDYYSSPIGASDRGSIDICHDIPVTTEEILDLASQAIDHVDASNAPGRASTAKKWLGRVLFGDCEKSLRQMQKEFNENS